MADRFSPLGALLYPPGRASFCSPGPKGYIDTAVMDG